MYWVTPKLGRAGLEDNPTTAMVLKFFSMSAATAALRGELSGMDILMVSLALKRAEAIGAFYGDLDERPGVFFFLDLGLARCLSFWRFASSIPSLRCTSAAALALFLSLDEVHRLLFRPAGDSGPAAALPE